ncbi:kinesin-associated protein [Cystoisospora suis]|uniref:Kinesin-associated protein n=1 Tax=Cystoisospora suis TaxID=483139 RepID=A0A2C6LEU2_9APIC|nr:kinesin-associated protein [Cystoisospora suis]
MVKRGIIRILVEFLDRGHHYLDFACLAFLKKLSIITRNKDEIFSTGFLPKASRLLVGLVPEAGAETDTGTMLLKTLFNLSFDPLIRTEMIDSGILGQVTDVAKIPSFRKAILLLYQLTQDDRGRSLFTFHTSGIPFLMHLASRTPESVCINRQVFVAGG